MSKHSQIVYNKPTLRAVAIAAVIAMASFGSVAVFQQTARADIETRNISTSGIKFVGTQDLMRSVVVGDTFTYEDVTGVGSTHVDRIKAKVTIMALEGSKGDIKEYVINWGDFSAGAYMSPISETENRMVPVVGIQYRYELQTYEQVEADAAALDADPNYVRTPNWSAPISVGPTAVTSSSIRKPLGTQYILFQYRIQISDSTWRSGDYAKDENGDYVFHDEFGVPDPGGNYLAYEEVTEDNDRTWANIFSYYGPAEDDREDSELDLFQKVDWYFVDGLKIGDELQDIPVDPDEVNPDDFLYMQVSKQVGFDIAEVTFKIEFFDANDSPVLLDGLFVNAYDVDQEQTVEFQDVSSYEVTSDTILRAEEVVSGDSTRLIFYSENESATTSSSEFHSYRQARVKIYFEPTEVVTIKSTYPRSGSQRFDFGAGFPWVEEEEEEEVVASPRERATAPVATAVGPDRAKIIVGGFDHNSRKLTPRMQARIDRWLAKHSHLSTLTCTGFTSLPKRPTDVVLSENRGITACKYSKSQRPEVKTAVSKGIEDPRPGSDVRRVRLVLTK